MTAIRTGAAGACLGYPRRPGPIGTSRGARREQQEAQPAQATAPPARCDICMLDALDAGRALPRRSLSPVEVTRATLARIDALNPVAQRLLPRRPRGGHGSGARGSERRWLAGKPLSRIDGVPTSIKDLILTRGRPTLRGSRTVDPAQPWTEDAPATARLREAGAVLLGKTTTPEFGWRASTDSPLCGVTRNPWDTTRTPGRLVGRRGGIGGGRHGRARGGHRRRRLDSHSGRLHRHGRHEAAVRPRAGLARIADGHRRPPRPARPHASPTWR